MVYFNCSVSSTRHAYTTAIKETHLKTINKWNCVNIWFDFRIVWWNKINKQETITDMIVLLRSDVHSFTVNALSFACKKDAIRKVYLKCGSSAALSETPREQWQNVKKAKAQLTENKCNRFFFLFILYQFVLTTQQNLFPVKNCALVSLSEG